MKDQFFEETGMLVMCPTLRPAHIRGHFYGGKLLKANPLQVTDILMKPQQFSRTNHLFYLSN